LPVTKEITTARLFTKALTHHFVIILGEVNESPRNTNDKQPPYSPAALLSALGNSLTSPMLNQLFFVKGIYRPGKGVNYNGYYYDILKDEHSDTNITLIIPIALRHQVKDGQLIEATAFFNKRQQPATARIDLTLTVTELLSRQEKIVDDKEQQALELIQRKAHAGYKDLAAAIKRKLYAQQNVRITILIGQSAIIDKDITHQLRDAAPAYQIEFIRINLSQPAEIMTRLREYDRGEILILSRGGGENIQLFNNLDIAKTALGLKSIFVTAIGHHDDEPLLQKVADKAFITPTSLGQFLYDTYIATLEETSTSRARLISEITRQVELNNQAKHAEKDTKLAETAAALREMRDIAEMERNHLLFKLAQAKARARKLTVVLIVVIVVVVFILISIKR
jgi:hypothetical protein